MTDVLIRDEPHDTGEIPRTEPGQTTTNLTWVTQAPAFRRPDATFELAIIEGGCRTVVPEDAPEEFTTAPAEPPKLPPPPPPKVDDQQSAEIVWAQAAVADSVFDAHERWTSTWRPTVRTPGYVGRHRKVSRWDRLRVRVAWRISAGRNGMTLAWGRTWTRGGAMVAAIAAAHRPDATGRAR